MRQMVCDYFTLGLNDSIGGEVPHPNGKVAISYKQAIGKLQTDINLPPRTTGSFVWQTKTYKSG